VPPGDWSAYYTIVVRLRRPRIIGTKGPEVGLAAIAEHHPAEVMCARPQRRTIASAALAAVPTAVQGSCRGRRQSCRT
jgi:hypothetical protein